MMSIKLQRKKSWMALVAKVVSLTYCDFLCSKGEGGV